MGWGGGPVLRPLLASPIPPVRTGGRRGANEKHNTTKRHSWNPSTKRCMGARILSGTCTEETAMFKARRKRTSHLPAHFRQKKANNEQHPNKNHGLLRQQEAPRASTFIRGFLDAKFFTFLRLGPLLCEVSKPMKTCATRSSN